ncbi:MAG: hypothetical protein ACO1N3_02865 [Gammaproteobacteria bacterium]
MNNEHEKKRQSFLRAATLDQAERDAARYQNAEDMFMQRKDLLTSIERQLFPSVVLIELSHGRNGMGFFRHDNWLVSNAHVIHSQDEIIEGLRIKKHDGTERFLDVKQGFYRPWESVLSPDLVVLNTEGTHPGVVLPNFSSEEAHPEKYFFYIDTDFQIHFLIPFSEHDVMPIRFICEDGHIPEFGCSGSPIFSADVTLTTKPLKWRFAVVGAIYARCALDQSLCGISIDEEFDQIRQIILSTEQAIRYTQMSSCSSSIGDEHQTRILETLAQQEQQLRAAGILRFNAGHSALRIELPEGLERLAKNTYAKLEESYLQSIKDLSLEVIRSTFFEFLAYIRQHQFLFIAHDTDTPILETEHWRLDCKPGGMNGMFRILQIQDNTGRGVTVPGSKKSASSIFAQLKIQKTITRINGEPLGDDLLLSHRAIEAGEGEQTVSIVLDFTTMEPVKRHKYQIIERRSASPSLRLFGALPPSNINGYSILQQSVTEKEVDRINSTNDAGDTPLMALLKKPLTDLGQRSKAKLLIPMSIWNQPNNKGETAQTLLKNHAYSEELASYFELN